MNTYTLDAASEPNIYYRKNTYDFQGTMMIIIGASVILAALISVLIFSVRRRKKKRSRKDSEGDVRK